MDKSRKSSSIYWIYPDSSYRIKKAVIFVFYNRFIELCERNMVSPAAVTRELGLNNSSSTAWKRGAFPKGETLQKLADYFGVTVDYLLGIEEKEKLVGHMTNEQKKQYGEIMELLNKVPKDKMNAVLTMLKALADE